MNLSDKDRELAKKHGFWTYGVEFTTKELAAMLAERDNLTKVTRLEVIDADGRSYTNYKVTSLEFSFQDDDRTLKVFIKE